MAVGKYQPLTLTPINFSLTEGTSIPAPPDSPPLSSPSPTSTAFPQKRTGAPAQDSTETGHQSLRPLNTNDANGALSPTSPTGRRPSSVRKFLGLRPLSSSDSLSSERPGSPSTAEKSPTLLRKKSGSWFTKRKSTFAIGPVPEGKENQTSKANGDKRSFTAPPPAKEKKGPPPPALPELKSFGVGEETSNLGADDMFKNIK